MFKKGTHTVETNLDSNAVLLSGWEALGYIQDLLIEARRLNRWRVVLKLKRSEARLINAMGAIADEPRRRREEAARAAEKEAAEKARVTAWSFPFPSGCA
jgi:hypothetical protein